MIGIAQEDVEGIKFAIRAMIRKGVPVRATIVRTIWDALEGEDRYNKKENAALVFLQAYMEMGLCYADEWDFFDGVLERYHTCRELQYPSPLYRNERIPLWGRRLQNAVSGWNYTYSREMSAERIVKDIRKKIREGRSGRFIYHGAFPGGRSDLMVELIIGGVDNYLYNYRLDRYFVLALPNRNGG